MNELAGFVNDEGAGSWLPPRVQRAMAQEAAHEALESKRAQMAQEERAEDARLRNLTLAAELATGRGEEITALQLARGEIPGRTVGDVLAAAAAAAEADDRREGARLHRDGHGDPEPLHVFVGEPVIHHAARSEIGLQMFHRSRRFREARAAKAKAAAAAEASKNDWGLLDLDVNDRTGFR